MNTDSSQLKTKLNRLKSDFAVTMRRRLVELHELRVHMAKLSVSGSDYLLALKKLHLLAHSIAGSSATFGCSETHAIAARLEARVIDVIESLNPGDDFIGFVTQCIDKLEKSVANELSQDISSDIPRSSGIPYYRNSTQQRPLLYVVDDDEVFLEDISNVVKTAGYDVVTFDDINQLKQQVILHEPDVIIMDIVFPDDHVGGITTINEIQEGRDVAIPVIYISNHDSFHNRYALLKAGGARYFYKKPVNYTEMLQSLDILLHSHDHLNIPRILIIEDDEPIAEYHSLLLSEAGLEVMYLTDPTRTLEYLESFNPDVVVIDLYMPEINGADLANLIRLEQKYQYLSLVFLSSESDSNKQFAALKAGGDDFLTKPVDPSTFISFISHKARQSRNYITIARELEKTIAELEQFKIAMDEHAIVSIADTQGKITYANSRFLEISKYSIDELLGKNHNILNSGHHDKAFFESMWDTITKGNIWEGVIRNRDKQGNDYWVESSIIPFMDKDGLPYQYVSIRTDVTRIKSIEEELRINEERLRRSQQYANIGTWDWNIQSGELYWSEQIGPLFGYDNLVETTYNNFINAVHPEDRKLVNDAVTACVEQSIPYDIEHRIITIDGKVRWLNEKGDVVRSTDGTPLHMLGVVQDITRRKQAEGLLLALQETSDYAITQQSNLPSVFEHLLVSLLELTNSEYGFIGEVRHTDDGKPFIKAYGITNIAWDDETRDFYEKSAPTGLEFHELDNLFGHVITSGKPVITNDPASHPASTGIPKGHPEIKCFFGMPIYYGGKLLGMYAVANRTEGYDEELMHFLEPFNTSCARIINALHISREREEALVAMAIAKDEAERASRAKSEFLSRMSHELRTPMNAILGFAQLLEVDDVEPLSSDQKESVEQILRAGWHLLELINEVLDLSRIESGNMELELKSVDLNDVLHECQELVTPLTAQNQVQIVAKFTNASNPLLVLGDRTRIKQVILNLLSNAIKYNRENGEVRLSLSSPNSAQIRLSIIDTGHGIPPEKMEDLFEPFNRLDANNSNIEGTGIGLVISRHLAELMGGRIGVNSNPGKGSEFWLDLNLSSDNSGLNADIETKNPAVNIDQSNFTKVVYVEDNPANTKLVTKLIETIKDISLQCYETAEAALENLDESIDLILMDINLPGMDGFAALKEIHKKYPQLPIIALSANAMPSDIERAKDAGFEEYLTKPIDVAKFREVIAKFITA